MRKPSSPAAPPRWREAPPASLRSRPSSRAAASEGVAKGRIDPCEFARLTASNPARLFGLYPRKGTIAPGADADLVMWDATKRVTITNTLLQHVIDYTPYEGLQVTGWPVATIRRGEIVMRDGKVPADLGTLRDDQANRPGAGWFRCQCVPDVKRKREFVMLGRERSASCRDDVARQSWYEFWGG